MQHRRVLYTVEEAADLLGVSPSTMYRWVRAGDLRTVPLNGRLAVPASSLERLFATPADGESEAARPEQDLNEVFLTGTLVSDPEIRLARTGLRYATLRLAVNRVHPTKAPFHVVVVAFGGRADDTATLHAGDLVRVDGCLGQREWTAEDGTRIGAQRVIADRIRAIGVAIPEEAATAEEAAS
jgi:excisionase family DNA binding protein